MFFRQTVIANKWDWTFEQIFEKVSMLIKKMVSVFSIWKIVIVSALKYQPTLYSNLQSYMCESEQCRY